MSFRNTLLFSSLALGSSAHMFISSPVPIEGTNVKPPLDASGSDWPCHGVSLPTTGGQAIKAGSNQTLAFDLGGGANTAVHGGGSCQISITYETDPAKQKDPANWKVIYSILGGCPSDTKGNLETAVACPENAPDCVNSFDFTIPEGLKSGHAIMAWTWFNTIGNREMYMNCINANIQGGDGSEVDSLPAMFVANLASVNTCPTVEQTNVRFPNPGARVVTHTQGNPYPLAVPTGAGCAPATKGSASSSTESSSAAALSTSVAASPTAPAKTTAPPATSSSTATVPAPAKSSSPAAQQGSGNCPSGQTACSTPGSIVCIDSTHFGICDIDHCAIPQSVAAGTTCSNGQIMRKREFRS